MLKVKKDLDESNYPIYKINTDKGLFEICFGGNLDLYWIFIPKNGKKDSYSFDVTKGEYHLYNLLDEIYDAVESCKPFKYSPKLKIDYNDKKISISDIKTKEYLLKNDTIIWISDDGMEDDGAKVSIKKYDDKYEITFIKGWAEYHYTYNVRFRNSGSRYYPFNAPFGAMYNKLKYYDDSQIHVEEYLYNQKKLSKPKV